MIGEVKVGGFLLVKFKSDVSCFPVFKSSQVAEKYINANNGLAKTKPKIVPFDMSFYEVEREAAKKESIILVMHVVDDPLEQFPS